MADKIVGMETAPANVGVPVKYIDQGDGTFALKVATTGGGGGGGAVTVADGADVAEGATTDAVVAAGAAGTVSAKLRAISRDVGTTAASGATSALQTTGNTSLATIAAGTPSLGQKTGANSSPVVIASDQASLPITTADVSVAATNITAQNLNPTSGAATANSTVSVALSGQNLVTANIGVNSLGANCTAQITYDGSNWVSLAAYVIVTASPQTIVQSASIASGTTGQIQWQVGGAKGFRLSANTATVSGTLTANLNASTAASPLVANVSLGLLSGTAAPAVITGAGGSSTSALVTGAAAATTAADYSAQAWAAASGSGGSTTDAAGAVCAFDVNLSAFTAGSSTGFDTFLDSSKDGGTTWDTHWQCEALTAAGHAATPPLVIPGARRRWRWVNRGGAATTATVTITANRASVAPAKVQRQFFDRTSTLVGVSAGAVAVGATTTGWINGVATAGAGYETGGASTIGATIPVLSAATTAPTYQLQVCPFNSTNANDWVGVGTAVQASTTAATRLSYTGVTERYFRVICTVAGSGVTGSYIALTAS